MLLLNCTVRMLVNDFVGREQEVPKAFTVNQPGLCWSIIKHARASKVAVGDTQTHFEDLFRQRSIQGGGRKGDPHRL